jgi:ABC-type multidrug transport system ATPase subunit
VELVIENLGKQYGKQWGLRNFSMRCGSGILGLVGPNGAGKTTLMRMVATLLEASEGSIYWNGQNIRTHGAELRQVLGYLPQEFGLYPEFSGRQFLRYLAAMKGLPKVLAQRRVDEVIEIVNLETAANRKLAAYSGGMKQRIGIAQALLNDPELLIVDEPTAGLDPTERVRFRNLLTTMTLNCLTILSTHIISDVEATADRLVVLQEGQMLVDATPEALLNLADGKVWSVETDSATALHLQAINQISGMIHTTNGAQLRIISSSRPHSEAVPVKPHLEDAYLLVTSNTTVQR